MDTEKQPMQISTRKELVDLLWMIADPEWHGATHVRTTIAATAAQAIELLGESQDDTKAKLAEMREQMDVLLKRVPAKQ